jgi:hypothetical protein
VNSAWIFDETRWRALCERNRSRLVILGDGYESSRSAQITAPKSHVLEAIRD